MLIRLRWFVWGICFWLVGGLDAYRLGSHLIIDGLFILIGVVNNAFDSEMRDSCYNLPVLFNMAWWPAKTVEVVAVTRPSLMPREHSRTPKVFSHQPIFYFFSQLYIHIIPTQCKYVARTKEKHTLLDLSPQCRVPSAASHMPIRLSHLHRRYK